MLKCWPLAILLAQIPMATAIGLGALEDSGKHADSSYIDLR